MNVPPVISNQAQPAPERSTTGKSHWWIWGTVLLAVSSLLVLHRFNPSLYAFYPRCVLYTTTGIYCPGCGCLRATYQLLHGHFLNALRCNPLYVLSLPVLGYYLGKRLVKYFTEGVWTDFDLNSKTVMWILVVMTVFTILRNIHAVPFCYLAPG